MSFAKMSARPSEYVVPDQFQAMTGLNNPALAASLWQTPMLRLSIDDFLRDSLLPLPQLPGDTAGMYESIVFSSRDELLRLARIQSVLINFSAVISTTQSQRLNTVIEWCGDARVLDVLRKGNLPVFAAFPVLSSLSIDMLELYAGHVLTHLIGVLPKACRQRLLLRFPAGTFAGEKVFPAEDPDRQVFETYVRLAVPIWSSGEAQDAQD
ncbi:hypothetical protein N6L27_15820 [Leisingera sp. SS27]|uniref:hypothetical protein n=1 Tax=Leisingera sp. SS27 TaxID=2979462 RepID=UPI00232B3046|nr:hypothetical protein [Leisingera sp. SS27]MDC0659469.1 hypothetical protein [Leisingera sp. SS27]